MGRITEAVKHLVIINIIFFIAPQVMPNLGLENLFALYFPENEKFGFWQFLTHMFMHGGFSHILFNMYGLWAFGTPLEQIWGRNKFLFFYFSAGLGAGVIYSLVNYYQFNAVYEQLVKPDTFFTQEVLADGDHVVIKVNGKITVDTKLTGDNAKLIEGHFAIQQHDPGSTVKIKKIEVIELP